jgi:hypothetical protein
MPTSQTALLIHTRSQTPPHLDGVDSFIADAAVYVLAGLSP